jgi:hypothetical protein
VQQDWLTIDKRPKVGLFVITHHEFRPEHFNLLSRSDNERRQTRPSELEASLKLDLVLHGSGSQRDVVACIGVVRVLGSPL